MKWKEMKDRLLTTERKLHYMQEQHSTTDFRTDFTNIGYATLVRNGQEHSLNGDGVQVLATIYLPTLRNEGNYIHPNIEFGLRLKIAGEFLTKYWGSQAPNDHKAMRYTQLNFIASTWKAAFKNAMHWTREERTKLESALKIRADALINAE